MGLYTNIGEEAREVEMEINMDELHEAFFYDDHYSDSDEEKRELLENADTLLEGKISRKTIVKLNRNDDLTRRTSMAALQLARDNNDNLWKKLVKNRIQERKILAAIKKKYAGKASATARQAQRSYVTKGGNKPIASHSYKPVEMAKSRH